jgi:hypothetical protein
MAGAIEIPGFRLPAVAGENLTAAQFKFVYLSADMTIMLADDTVSPIGILQNNPNSGEEATVMINGVSKVKIDVSGALTAGAVVSSSSAGTAIAATTGEYTVGQIVVGAAAGCIGSVLLKNDSKI